MDLASLGIGGAAATAFFAVIGGMLKRSINQLDKKLESHDVSIAAQNKAITDYQLYAEKHFVTSDELTKAIGNLEGTIERLIESVDTNAKEMREWFRLLQQTKADK